MARRDGGASRTWTELVAGAAVAAVVGATTALAVHHLGLGSQPVPKVDGGSNRNDRSEDQDPSTDKLARQSVPRPLSVRVRSTGSSICSSRLVQKFVLTGGPCGGKTTALARLRSFLQERGFRVFIVPEAATMLWANGVAISDMKNDDDWVNFQIKLMQMQMHFEDTFFRHAESTGEQAVLICDRGAMDGKAYVSQESWDAILRKQGFDEVRIRDSRYNAVLHMVTAADGAEAFYGSDTNATRSEDAESARQLDKRIQQAWLGHHRQLVFDNRATGGFEAKMALLINKVSQLVGLPSTGRRARKFLLSSLPSESDFAQANIDVKVFDIEKCYPLQIDSQKDEENGYTYVRRRAHQGYASYGETRVRIKDGAKLEMKRVLTEREYAVALLNADPSRNIVRTRRTCFIFGSLSIYIEQFLTPAQGLVVMYVQWESTGKQAERGDEASAEESPVLQLPSFLQSSVTREVTGVPEFSAYHISLA